MEELITLYRPTGAKELELVRESGFAKWPLRLPEQPIFYPVTNEDYAVQIVRDWNVKAGGAGFVTRFHVRKSFMDRYAIKKVGGNNHTEWWIPAEDLEEMNRNLVGLIEVVREFAPEQAEAHRAGRDSSTQASPRAAQSAISTNLQAVSSL